jgi:hypothetical protein
MYTKVPLLASSLFTFLFFTRAYVLWFLQTKSSLFLFLSS